MAFAGKLLLGGALPARDRELVILRSLWLTGARNEWFDHLRIARRAGVSAEAVDRIIEGPDATGWSELDAALVRLADEMHTTADVTDETWATLAAAYDERQLIELPMLAGQYHLVAYVCNALRIAPDPSTPERPMADHR